MTRHTLLSTGVATLAALGLAALPAHAQTTIFAYNFDGGTAGNAAFGATASTGTATFTNNFANPGTDVVYVAGETSGTTDTALRVNVGANAVSPATTSQEEGNSIQFAFSAANFNALSFQYDTQRSNSGFTTETVAYSSNGGTTFTNVTASQVSSTAAAASSAGAAATINSDGTITPPTAPSKGSGYGTVLINLSSVAALNNNAADVFRITFTGSSGTGSTTANARIDNLFVSGTPIAAAPEPSGVVALALGAGVLGLMVARCRKQNA